MSYENRNLPYGYWITFAAPKNTTPQEVVAHFAMANLHLSLDRVSVRQRPGLDSVMVSIPHDAIDWLLQFHFKGLPFKQDWDIKPRTFIRNEPHRADKKREQWPPTDVAPLNA